MKSITESLETKNETQLWVQVSDGGQVTLSMDTRYTSTVLSGLSVKDLSDYHKLIGKVLEDRETQLQEEQNATTGQRPHQNQATDER